MKRILFLIIGLLFAIGCSDTEPDIYNDDNLLNFNMGVESAAAVPVGDVNKDFTISYGVIKPISGSHQVKLIYDAANSEAVEGTDFEIVDSTDELTDGEVGGTFTVRVYEATMTTTPKIARFKLVSSTIQNAIFDQTYRLNMSLKCPLDTFFAGNFDVPLGFWNSPDNQTPGGQYMIETDATQPGKLFVRDFLSPGNDLVVSVSSDESQVFVDEKYTGFNVTYQGVLRQIWVRQRSGTTNSFSACGRTMKLFTQYYLKDAAAAYGGDTSETFEGI